MAVSIIKGGFGVNNRKRILNIASGTTGPTYTDIANDILNAVGTLPSNMMIEGLHDNAGIRYFNGFLYRGKTYGSFIVQENYGHSYKITINNGEISKQVITTS
jgi:hypothetical protein